MNVLVVEPGYLPYEKEINGLKEEQAVVGGRITAMYPYSEPIAIVSNDDSLEMRLPFNRSVPGGYGGVFGTFFICGLEEDHFCSLTPKQVERFKKEYSKAEFLIGAKGNDLITMKFAAEPKPDPSKGKEHTAPGHDR